MSYLPLVTNVAQQLHYKLVQAQKKICIYAIVEVDVLNTCNLTRHVSNYSTTCLFPTNV